jgi:hypothetical protein
MTRDQAVSLLTAIPLLLVAIAYNHGWLSKGDLDAALTFLAAGHLGYHVNNTAANLALNPEPKSPPYDDDPPAQLTP